MKKKASAFAIIIVLLLLAYGIVLLVMNTAANAYAVTFEVDGEVVHTATAPDVEFPGTPAKNGHSFAGWYWTSPYGSMQISNGYFLNNTVRSDMLVYATWTTRQDNVVTGTETVEFDRIVYIENPDLTALTGGFGFGGTSSGTGGAKETLWEYDPSQVIYDSGKAGGLTLYVVWLPETNELTLQVGGGSGTVSEGALLASQAVQMLPALIQRAGYSYGSLSAIPPHAGVSGGSHAVSSSAPADTHGYTVFVEWTPNENTVVYDANGGEGTMPAGIFKSDTPKALAQNKYEKEGYRFAGWTLTADGTGDRYADGALFDIGIRETCTLYAQWELLPSVVRYHGGIDAFGEMPADEAAANAAHTLAANIFTRARYRFEGWASTPGGAVQYADGGSLQAGTNEIYDLFAVWVRRTDADYCVEYYEENIAGNYVFVRRVAKSAEVGTMAKAELPTRLGYHMHDGFSLLSAEVPDEDNAFVLRVYYERDRFTFRFFGNGGTLTDGVEEQEIPYGGDAVPPVYERPGYRFAGYDAGHTSVTANAVAVAQWMRAEQAAVTHAGENAESITTVLESKPGNTEPENTKTEKNPLPQIPAYTATVSFAALYSPVSFKYQSASLKQCQTKTMPVQKAFFRG